MNHQNNYEFHKNLFEFPAKAFKLHLKIPGNTRILFSGKFGIGKSYFLNHFFKEEIQVGEMSDALFRVFHLYPINYSIASNEDIFKYIKYDVITSMLLKNIELEESDFAYIDTLPEYLRGNLMKVLATIVYMMPKVGKDIFDSYQKLEELRSDFVRHSQKLNESDGDKLVSYLGSIENKEGGLFENNIITNLIHKILTRLKQQSDKENVLIIDDLDRIDPEHIFRLLNVFAAHLDNPSGLPNKLGFDKVIIVCDVNNLRNIFRAKYGVQTDFNGYIDKFYSYDVFHFDNREILKDIAYQVFKSVDFPRVSGHVDYYRSKIVEYESPALELLYILISNGMVSLRALIAKFYKKIEVRLDESLKFNSSIIESEFEHPIFVQFRILKEVVGGYEVLKDYLLRIPAKGYDIRHINLYSKQLIYYVHYDQTLRVKGNPKIEFNNKELYIKLPENKVSNFRELQVVMALGGNVTEYTFSIKEFQLLLSEFIDLLKRVGN